MVTMRIAAVALAVTVGLASPGVARADTPSNDVQATCDGGLTIVTSGYPDGAAGMFSVNDEPPRALHLNMTVHVDWPITTTDLISYTVQFVPGAGTDPSVYAAGSVECAGAAIVVPEPAPRPVVAVEPVLPALDLTPWAQVALAPPW